MRRGDRRRGGRRARRGGAPVRRRGAMRRDGGRRGSPSAATAERRRGAGGAANSSFASCDDRARERAGSTSGSVGAAGHARAAARAPASARRATARRRQLGPIAARAARRAAARPAAPSPPRSGVLMVVVDLDALEHAERVVRSAPRPSSRATSRYCAAPFWLMPIKRTDRLGLTSPGQAGLEQADDAALLLAGAHQQDVGLLALDRAACRTGRAAGRAR